MKRKLGTADSLELANYLGKLLLVKTKGNDEIRAYRIRDFINSRLNGEKIVEVAKKTETNPRNIGNWLGNTKRDIGFPLSKLLIVSKIYNIRNQDLFGAIKIFGCTDSKKSRLPKRITPRLAYLLGYLMGDGHLANPKDTISNGFEYNAEVKNS